MVAKEDIIYVDSLFGEFPIRRKEVSFELLEKTKGMMKLEFAYANFEQAGPDAAEYAGDCWPGKRGLFVQILRDADARTSLG